MTTTRSKPSAASPSSPTAMLEIPDSSIANRPSSSARQTHCAKPRGDFTAGYASGGISPLQQRAAQQIQRVISINVLGIERQKITLIGTLDSKR